MSNRNQNNSSQSVKQPSNFILKYTIVGVLFSLLIVLFSWTVDLSLKEIAFNFYGLKTIHSENPVHFIIDFMPLIAGLIIYFSLRYNESTRKKLLAVISERNILIENNAAFAKQIGEGDFSAKIEITKNDMLGKSLLVMRDNLSLNYLKENELNWIAKGKEQIADVLRHHTNIGELAYDTLVSLINYIDVVQGMFYIYNEETQLLENIASYAFNRKKHVKQSFKIGYGLIGQAAYEMEIIYRTEVPNDYITISSGILGDQKPRSLLITPLISDEKLQGVIEFASLDDNLSDKKIRLIRELSEIIAQTLFNLKVNTRTENLLDASQIMTKELQEQQEQLRENAEVMQETQKELELSNNDLEAQISEVEKAQKRQHSLLENASEVITIYDETGIVQYVSPSVQTILGYDPNEMIGKNRFKRGESVLQEAFDELIENPKIKKIFEYRYEKKNHGVVWLETIGLNLINNPAIKGIIFNTRDITVRKIAEKAQRMSGEMQALSENSPDLIVRLSAEGKFFYVNPVVEAITGIPVSEIKQKKLGEVNFPQEIISFFKIGLEKVLYSQSKYEVENSFPTIDGERIMQFNAIPEFNKEKELETVLFVAHDITERKNFELEINKKNKNITESINYAQRIQSAIIPDQLIIKERLPHSFIFYKPRDVVSGDFTWFFEKGDDIYIAAVDCTGHGVPGALLSFIGYFLLNNIVDHDTETTASQILDQLHTGVRRTLKQDRGDASARDGMDIALCKINFKKQELQYSGAHRPLYFLTSGELQQFKGNPKAIGGIPPRRKKEADFKNYIINFELGDKIFIFSDGLPDQIGQKTGRKYQAKKIREIITTYPDYSMDKYYDYFKNDFFDWKGNHKQIDDVLLIGIELQK